jgi:hypothetical protein
MGVFEKYLASKDLTKIKGTIGDHQAAVRSYFQERFAGKPAANPYLQKAVKEGAAKLKAAGATDDAKKFAEVPGGKGDKARTDFIAAVEGAIQEAFNGLEPPPAPSTLKYEDIDKRFADPKLETRIEGLQQNVAKNIKAKICSIYGAGSRYKGHGPTTALGSGVLHAHVGNGDGIAFKWEGETLVIHGYGVKDDSAKPGNSGYAWTTK